MNSTQYEQTKQIVEHSLQYAQGRTLDLGAGTAKYKDAILKKATEYIAFDLFPGDRIDVTGDITDTKFPAGSFDTIYCTQVLEHIPRPEAAVLEISRLLKPGGVIIVTAPFIAAFHSDPHDYYRYSVEGLRQLFRAELFEIVESGSYTKFFVILTEFIKHTLFSPYKKRKKGSYIILNTLVRIATWFDRSVSGKSIYGNVYLIAKKK